MIIKRKVLLLLGLMLWNWDGGLACMIAQLEGLGLAQAASTLSMAEEAAEKTKSLEGMSVPEEIRASDEHPEMDSRNAQTSEGVSLGESFGGQTQKEGLSQGEIQEQEDDRDPAGLRGGAGRREGRGTSSSSIAPSKKSLAIPSGLGSGPGGGTTWSSQGLTGAQRLEEEAIRVRVRRRDYPGGGDEEPLKVLEGGSFPGSPFATTSSSSGSGSNGGGAQEVAPEDDDY